MLCSAFGLFANEHELDLRIQSCSVVPVSVISPKEESKFQLIMAGTDWTAPVKWLLGLKSPERNSLPHTHTTTRGDKGPVTLLG
jgi:hypothetical protein